MTPLTGKKIGEILLRNGNVEEEQLKYALAEQKKSKELIGQVLLNLKYTSEDQLFEALAQQMHVPFMKIQAKPLTPELQAIVPAKIAIHYQILPVKYEDDVVFLAIADPFSLHLAEELKLSLKKEVEFVLTSPRDLQNALKKTYGIGADTLENIIEKETPQETDKDTDNDITFVEVGTGENLDEAVQEPSIIKFVNEIISEAIKDRATDIHVEPFEDELRIRYRIDGLLYCADIPPTIKKFQSAIITRIKIMAGMDIAERRVPQDGRIKLQKSKEEYDLRVSTLPTPSGENISIRILNKTGQFIELQKLGLEKANYQLFRFLIEKPHGIILVSGPTGSGKSTSLYAALKEINNVDKKVITIEDPIEYRLPGVVQIQINAKIGLTFASSLRAILRNDPDVIMVGEIRDLETAEISIRTALTGHLVFSTIHTNNAAGSVTRLIDMGIEPFLVSSSVEGMIAQRLVRRICPVCKMEYEPDPLILKRLGIKEDEREGVVLFKGRGCEACKYTGYKGRIAIFEIIRLNEKLRHLIVQQTPASVIQLEAIRMGMRTLRLDGWDKAKAGQTTVEEVFRVTQDEFSEIEGIN